MREILRQITHLVFSLKIRLLSFSRFSFIGNGLPVQARNSFLLLTNITYKNICWNTIRRKGKDKKKVEEFCLRSVPYFNVMES